MYDFDYDIPFLCLLLLHLLFQMAIYIFYQYRLNSNIVLSKEHIFIFLLRHNSTFRNIDEVPVIVQSRELDN